MDKNRMRRMGLDRGGFAACVLSVVCASVFLVCVGALLNVVFEEKRQDEAFSQLRGLFPEFEAYSGRQEAQPDAWSGSQSGGQVSGVGQQALGRSQVPEIGQQVPGSGQAPEVPFVAPSGSQVSPSGHRAVAGESVAGQIVSAVNWEAVREEWCGRLSGYQKLWEMNQDFVGWIRIDGTRIDYPVMQSPDRPDYYLHRNFDKGQSAFGVPYVFEPCVLGPEGTNLLIYGHHMKSGSMFAALEGYRETQFYREHPYIRFDTRQEPQIYQVTGAWLVADGAGQGETLFQLLFPLRGDDVRSGWEAVKGSLFVNTGMEPSGRLLALATCDYSGDGGRIVVLAQQIKGESQ